MESTSGNLWFWLLGLGIVLIVIGGISFAVKKKGEWWIWLLIILGIVFVSIGIITDVLRHKTVTVNQEINPAVPVVPVVPVGGVTITTAPTATAAPFRQITTTTTGVVPPAITKFSTVPYVPVSQA